MAVIGHAVKWLYEMQKGSERLVGSVVWAYLYKSRTVTQSRGVGNLSLFFRYFDIFNHCRFYQGFGNLPTYKSVLGLRRALMVVTPCVCFASLSLCLP